MQLGRKLVIPVAAMEANTYLQQQQQQQRLEVVVQAAVLARVVAQKTLQAVVPAANMSFFQQVGQA